MPGEDVGANRKNGDRREHNTGGDRRGEKKATSRLAFVLRSLGLVVILLLVIVYTVANTRPIYATRGTLGAELRKHAPEVAAALSPADSAHSANVDLLMATPKFQDEKRNFYEDVMRLKQVDSARADSIAEFAVREAYIRGISPAIVFGVMLTENAKFVSAAKSNVGAVGLMQVYPKIWLTKEMTALFGTDLASDSTNVKYGVFILSQYFRPKTGSGKTRERNWQTALLRYNGCVRGTNTPRCHTYPNKVQKFVEGSAKSICDGRGFYDCIAKPFIGGLFGATNGIDSTKASK
jgi:Transglycosylase SLT domain